MESRKDRAPQRNPHANACLFSGQSSSFSSRRTPDDRPNQKLGPNKDRNSTRKRHSRKHSIAESSFIIASTERLGPEPADLPKKVLGLLLRSSHDIDDDEERRLMMDGIEEWFSGSVCAQSPPPWSLPLPNFMKRLKGGCGGGSSSCNGEAEGAGIDVLATQGLRCLLGL
ncbi:hypothetical protein ACLOJK_027994 [Asimina triloba]